MKILTKENLKSLPKLYSGDNKGLSNLKFYVKLFTPDSCWTWYLAEFDPETGIAFGLVHGFESELGYFSLDEITQVKGPLGLPVERDRSFLPCDYETAMKLR